jgi:hypothetical protein
MYFARVVRKRGLHLVLPFTIVLVLASGFFTTHVYGHEPEELEMGPGKRLPRLPDAKKKKKWEKRCLDGYVRCIDAGGGSMEGRVYGESQCRACRAACLREEGVWPKEANEKPCPGG